MYIVNFAQVNLASRSDLHCDQLETKHSKEDRDGFPCKSDTGNQRVSSLLDINDVSDDEMMPRNRDAAGQRRSPVQHREGYYRKPNPSPELPRNEHVASIAAEHHIADDDRERASVYSVTLGPTSTHSGKT
jgi:hypothetical protein